ncbi:MAG: hypothetical protein U0791_05875 [Gemmataceae bacterium]
MKRAVFEVVQVANLDMLAWLGDQFRAESARTRNLFHATRLLVDPDEDPVANLESDWSEFRLRTPFAFGSIRRPVSGFQHACFHGDESLVDRFVALALLACQNFPEAYLPMRVLTPGARAGAHFWMLAVHQVALQTGGSNSVKWSGSDNSPAEDSSSPPWPGMLVTDLRQDIDRSRDDLIRWQQHEIARTGRRKARYIYATLRKDVFTASAQAIDYLVTNEKSLFMAYDPDSLGGPEGGLSTNKQREPELEAEEMASHPNASRDTWMNKLAEQGKSFKEIHRQLKNAFKQRDWNPLGDPRAVSMAITRYRARHGLPPIKRRDR